MTRNLIILLSVLLIVFWIPAPLWAANHGHKGDRAAPDPTEVHQGHGIVEAVDPAASTIRVEHDPIESLRWPGMVMVLKVTDPELIKAVAEGDEIAFDLMRIDGEYVITRIERKMKR